MDAAPWSLAFKTVWAIESVELYTEAWFPEGLSDCVRILDVNLTVLPACGSVYASVHARKLSWNSECMLYPCKCANIDKLFYPSVRQSVHIHVRCQEPWLCGELLATF